MREGINGCDALRRFDGEHTILMVASVRFMKVGMTSPSSPAASSWAASHRDRTVPTSWAKHSDHTRSVLGLPPVRGDVSSLDGDCALGTRMMLTRIQVVQLEEVALLI